MESRSHHVGRDGGGQDRRRRKLTPQGAADLFAFFYSARFFDKPGEAESGKVLFESKQCGTCHGITDSRAEGATPVEKWESLADPILLVQQMWNHSFRMRQAFARRGLKWQVLTGAELNDILVYLRSLPETTHLGTRFLQHQRRGRRAALRIEGLRQLPSRRAGAGEPAEEHDADRYRGGHVESRSAHAADAARVHAE